MSSLPPPPPRHRPKLTESPPPAVCFFLGILFASFPYDFPLLWTKDPVPDAYYDQLEAHLRFLHGSPPLISRLLGRIGLTIVVRVLGLILCALAVQFVLIGVGDATRGLVRQDAKAPYADHR